jgi:CCR4-NOT transcriptional regulation complex NOT5 subunit
MPLGFANFRHDPTLSSRSPQAQKPSVEAAQQKASSSAASVSSEQPLIEEKKTDRKLTCSLCCP